MGGPWHNGLPLNTPLLCAFTLDLVENNNYVLFNFNIWQISKNQFNTATVMNELSQSLAWITPNSSEMHITIFNWFRLNQPLHERYKRYFYFMIYLMILDG